LALSSQVSLTLALEVATKGQFSAPLRPVPVLLRRGISLENAGSLARGVVICWEPFQKGDEQLEVAASKSQRAIHPLSSR